MSVEVEFLEERLALLETWLESTKDDDNNEGLIEKREEYRGLIEETILLQKKLRKTSKLLSAENSEKMLQKLSKKQDQYLCEIDEIMNYAETDVLFETAEIEPNELLGEPLETLMEQPGMEGSCSSSLNFSMSDFMPNAAKVSKLSLSESLHNLHPITENNGTQSAAKNHESMATISTDSTSLFTASSTNSNTYNHDEKTLRKKLRKVEKLLAAQVVLVSNHETSQLNATQVKKLRKKQEQYTQALQYIMKNASPSSPMGNDSRDLCFDPLSISPNDIEGAQLEEDLQEEIDEIIEEEIVEEEIEEYAIEEYEYSNHDQRHVSPVYDTRNHSGESSGSYDRKTLKKKLKKVKRMMESTSDAKELGLYKQKKKEYKMALQAIKEQDNGVEKSSRCRYSQHEPLKDEKFEPIDGDNGYTPSSHSVHSPSPLHSHSRHDNGPSEKNNDQIEVFQKKLRKANKGIDKARKENDSKKLKKMEKKRQEYQTTLNELLR